jgi:hypothetical protein
MLAIRPGPFGGSTNNLQKHDMTKRLKTLARVSAALAFVICLAGGIWILASVGFDHDGDAVQTGIGLYFVGKAFFVGPMLLLAAEQLGKGSDSR